MKPSEYRIGPAPAPTNLNELEQAARARLLQLMHTQTVNEGERWLLMWQYRYPMGSFMRGMTEALTNADGSNLVKLYRAFPEHVTALMGYRTVEAYWELVKLHGPERG